MVEQVEIILSAEEKKALQAINRLDKRLGKLTAAAEKNTGLIESNFNKLSQAANVAIGNIVGTLTLRLFDTLRRLPAEAFDAFRDFERGLIGVGKTTDITGRQLNELGDDIQRLAKQTPFATDQLLEIAKAAGQLGVRGREDIINFTETIAKLGTATDIEGEAAALALTRILTVTREGTDAIDELASVIVRLGNEFAAQESEIVEFTNEVARGVAQFGVGAEEAAAIATALKSLGVDAEAGGSAIARTFDRIGVAIREGGKPLRILQELTGQTRDQLRKAFAEDSVKVFQQFIAGVGRTGEVNATLSAFGLTAVRTRKALAPLAQNTELLARSLNTAADEFQNATALEKEFQRASESLDAQITRLFNNIQVRAQEALEGDLGRAITGLVAAINKGLGDDGSEAVAKLEAELAKLEDRAESLSNLLNETGADTGSFLGDLAENAKSAIGRVFIGNLENARLEQEKLNKEIEQTRLRLLEAQVAAGQVPLTRGVQEQLEGLDQDKTPKQDPSVAAKIAADERKLELEREFQERLRAVRAEFDLLDQESALEKALAEEDLNEQKIQSIIAQLEIEKQLRDAAALSAIEDDKKREIERQKIENQNFKKRIQAEKQLNAQFTQLRNQNAQQTLQLASAVGDAIVALSGDNAIAALAISKAAAVADVFIKDAQARAAAVLAATTFAAAAGPGAPAAFAAALATFNSLITTQTTVALATIAAQTVAGAARLQSGGIVPGVPSDTDNTVINAAGGEAVLTRRDQLELLNGIRRGNFGGGGGGNHFTFNNLTIDSEERLDSLIEEMGDRLEFGGQELRGVV